ncbi:hypothetical protein GCM10009744_58340 [Kribbella alba]|uniref:Uncharacterized protein n=1 Tax=Kribbella alba TaxID=190197 RepID=A0ABP4RQ72_9ACTN
MGLTPNPFGRNGWWFRKIASERPWGRPSTFSDATAPWFPMVVSEGPWGGPCTLSDASVVPEPLRPKGRGAGPAPFRTQRLVGWAVA